MHGGLVVSRGTLAPASFLLQLLDLFRSFRFGPILIEFFASFAAERLEIRALWACHGLIFRYPLVGIFLRIECCRRYIWRNVVGFHQRQIRFRSCRWICRNSQSALRATSRDVHNYTAIQVLVFRQDAICRESLERAIAIAFILSNLTAIPIP